MAYPRLADLNRYETVSDWTLDGIDGVILKATEANTVDRVFPNYWRSLKATNKVRGTYNYYRPVFDLYSQAYIYSSIARNTPLPPVIDVELYDGYSDDVAFYTNSSQEKIRSTLKDYICIITDLFGREPIIYTGPYFWNKYYGNVDWAKNYLLWIANYQVINPMIPMGWTEWKLWQYTDHGLLPGVQGNVDLNYFNGTLTELKILANVDPTVPPPPPPPTPKKLIVILVDQLRIRNAPNATTSKIIGYLPKDMTVDYIDIFKSGTDVWYQIGYQQWCAGIYNGYKYSEVEC